MKPSKSTPPAYTAYIDHLTPQQPTVVSVANDLIARGADRGSLVRHAKDDRHVALLIFMLSQEAIFALCPIILEVAAREEFYQEAPSEPFVIVPNITCALLFDWMQTHNQFFLWSGDPEEFNIAVAVMGSEACEWLAPRLTAAHCPAFLEPY